jgi:hypothetical protein
MWTSVRSARVRLPDLVVMQIEQAIRHYRSFRDAKIDGALPMSNSDAQPPSPTPPPPREDLTKFGWVIGGALIALLGGIALFALGEEERRPDIMTQDAAVVGDVVTIRDAASTALCEDRNDASKIHMIGEVTKRQTDLFEKDAGKSMMRKDAARNAAMREAPSCQWAPRGVRYTVKQKEIVGTESDEFHVVVYCLQPHGKDNCLWVEETFDRKSPIERTSHKS